MFSFFRKKFAKADKNPPENQVEASPEAAAMPQSGHSEPLSATAVAPTVPLETVDAEPVAAPQQAAAVEPVSSQAATVGSSVAAKPESDDSLLLAGTEVVVENVATLPGADLIVPAEPAPKPHVPRQGWLQRLSAGLRKTGGSIATVFTGTKIDEALYEELEDALLMADTGVKATEALLADLRRRVKEARATDPAAVKSLLADAMTDMLTPLEKSLVIGEHKPTVIMVAGVNGAGKTTSIGKLTRHLAEAGASVLLAAADTFRAAAREQLAVWANRNTVEIVTQEGGDPAAVSYDAVTAGRSRGRDVVLVDTAGRLPTQLHLMEELRKIKRTIGKAGGEECPHEVLLVIDGNTGQNALAQVKAFDDALTLTGLVITKLDGTAKGGVICAIAQERPVPVYFVGVGEQLEDLQTFNAREFTQALLG